MKQLKGATFQVGVCICAHAIVNCFTQNIKKHRDKETQNKRDVTLQCNKVLHALKHSIVRLMRLAC